MAKEGVFFKGLLTFPHLQTPPLKAIVFQGNLASVPRALRQFRSAHR